MRTPACCRVRQSDGGPHRGWVMVGACPRTRTAVRCRTGRRQGPMTVLRTVGSTTALTARTRRRPAETHRFMGVPDLGFGGGGGRVEHGGHGAVARSRPVRGWIAGCTFCGPQVSPPIAPRSRERGLAQHRSGFRWSRGPIPAAAAVRRVVGESRCARREDDRADRGADDHRVHRGRGRTAAAPRSTRAGLPRWPHRSADTSPSPPRHALVSGRADRARSARVRRTSFLETVASAGGSTVAWHRSSST